MPVLTPEGLRGRADSLLSGLNVSRMPDGKHFPSDINAIIGFAKWYATRETAGGWQTIDSIPQDGTRVYLSNGHIGRWSNQRKRLVMEREDNRHQFPEQPTHWQRLIPLPLPEPPTPAVKVDQETALQNEADAARPEFREMIREDFAPGGMMNPDGDLPAKIHHTSPPPEIDEIAKRHAHNRNAVASGLEQVMRDDIRALLAYVRRGWVVDREKLVGVLSHYAVSIFDEGPKPIGSARAEIIADALIASGLLKPMPMREAIARAIIEKTDSRGTQYALGAGAAADTILALIGGK